MTQLEKLADKIDPFKTERLRAYYYGDYNTSHNDMTWKCYEVELKEIIKEGIVGKKSQKLKVGRIKPFNSGYLFNLYAVFDSKGKFLYYQYDKTITCFIDDILDSKVSIFACDLDHLRKLERLN